MQAIRNSELKARKVQKMHLVLLAGIVLVLAMNIG